VCVQSLHAHATGTWAGGSHRRLRQTLVSKHMPHSNREIIIKNKERKKEGLLILSRNALWEGCAVGKSIDVVCSFSSARHTVRKKRDNKQQSGGEGENEAKK